MDNQPAFDRSVLIPILLGGFSVIGIIVVLLIGRSRNAPQEVPVTPSATRFQYLYLGTEPAITTPLGEGSETPLTEEPVEEPIEETPAFPTPTSSSNSTAIVTTTPGVIILPTSGGQRTNTPPGPTTSTATLSSPVAANTVDDTDSRLSYSGNWANQTGVSGAYQGTLHVSSSAGNSVSFTFTGPEIHLFYQASSSFGSITITIDGVGEPPVSQSQSQTEIREWEISDLSTGTHSIVITHSGGGSVNIDSLIVPAPPGTPTRTSTPTLTPTP